MSPDLIGEKHLRETQTTSALLAMRRARRGLRRPATADGHRAHSAGAREAAIVVIIHVFRQKRIAFFHVTRELVFAL